MLCYVFEGEKTNSLICHFGNYFTSDAL